MQKNCPPDKELNPKTGNCIKKCNADQERNQTTGRCVKRKNVVTKKNKVSPKVIADCPPDKERSLKTGNCIKKCNADQERNQTTGRCVKRKNIVTERIKSQPKVQPPQLSSSSSLTPQQLPSSSLTPQSRLKSSSTSSSYTKKQPGAMRLTEHNLIALNLKIKPQSVTKVVKSKVQKNQTKMTDKRRTKLMEEYQEYWNSFTNGYDAEIYDKMVKIAKKQYSKDEELAKFEEDFFQHFIKNDEYVKSTKKINRYYSERGHQKLINLREKANANN